MRRQAALMGATVLMSGDSRGIAMKRYDLMQDVNTQSTFALSSEPDRETPRARA
jgi:hypothetical protein